ncbi:MAG: septum formation protein Maf [Betaproteobacteria bacterium]|nr:septum formation protein Maf [Betaproteobacteria bacterium]
MKTHENVTQPFSPPTRRLVLASTSPYRKALLERLGLPFDTFNSKVDEGRLPGEPPSAMAYRLAETKARAATGQFPDSLIIGSDQVAESGGQIFGKPGNFENAKAQLLGLSERVAVFHNGLCVIDARNGTARTLVIPVHVHFRRLDESGIVRYLQREMPYDCAGSAKSEGLGIALIAKICGDDPTALIGLPLIALVDLLGESGVDVL